MELILFQEGNAFSVFNLFFLLGGVAFFLFGMNIMSNALAKLSGSKLESTLESATSSYIRSLMLGIGITVAIQSSSAMTVILVGLVNSGIMQLSQTVVIIMGSNIGTTLTAWITSLAGIQSTNTLVRLLKPVNFSPVFAFAGAVLLMFSKKERRKDIGEILLGFSVLMIGMVIMGAAVKPLEDNAAFQSMLTAFKNPIFGLLVGTVFTGIIQSSAATTALLQIFAISAGGLSWGAALPLIMGSNIGTCVTALIASIGVSKNAKRVALVHIFFNIIGTVIWFIGIYSVNLFWPIALLDQPVNPTGIAVFHSVFNISVTVLLTPVRGILVKIAHAVIRDKDGAPDETQKSAVRLDENLLNTPSFAVANSRAVVNDMLRIAGECAAESLDLVEAYSQEGAQGVLDKEAVLDDYEDKLGTFLVKLSQHEITQADSWQVNRMLRMIGDLERMGDHARNIAGSSLELFNSPYDFSDAAKRDYTVLKSAVSEIIRLAREAFLADDADAARHVEPLEQVVDSLVFQARARHIDRLQKGECHIELGFTWSDILINIERISDHCSNIAISVIQAPEGSMESHMYINMLETGENAEFKSLFDAYSGQYAFDA